jgi:D-sedoheptulose 7-phosphate isomerase
MEILNYLNTFFFRHKRLKVCRNEIISFYEAAVSCFKKGGFMYVVGNGGSASDCDHFAGEMLKGFVLPRRLGSEGARDMLDAGSFTNLQNALPVIPLTNFNSFNTAFSNDCNPQYVFAQLVWTLVKSSDILVCISTSGNSKNILEAAKVANCIGAKVVALTNYVGGSLKKLVKGLCINVPELETFKTQELHLPIYHIVSIILESVFFFKK